MGAINGLALRYSLNSCDNTLVQLSRTHYTYAQEPTVHLYLCSHLVNTFAVLLLTLSFTTLLNFLSRTEEQRCADLQHTGISLRIHHICIKYSSPTSSVALMNPTSTYRPSPLRLGLSSCCVSIDCIQTPHTRFYRVTQLGI